MVELLVNALFTSPVQLLNSQLLVFLFSQVTPLHEHGQAPPNCPVFIHFQVLQGSYVTGLLLTDHSHPLSSSSTSDGQDTTQLWEYVSCSNTFYSYFTPLVSWTLPDCLTDIHYTVILLHYCSVAPDNFFIHIHCPVIPLHLLHLLCPVFLIQLNKLQGSSLYPEAILSNFTTIWKIWSSLYLLYSHSLVQLFNCANGVGLLLLVPFMSLVQFYYCTVSLVFLLPVTSIATIRLPHCTDLYWWWRAPVFAPFTYPAYQYHCHCWYFHTPDCPLHVLFPGITPMIEQGPSSLPCLLLQPNTLLC